MLFPTEEAGEVLLDPSVLSGFPQSQGGARCDRDVRWQELRSCPLRATFQPAYSEAVPRQSTAMLNESVATCSRVSVRNSSESQAHSANWPISVVYQCDSAGERLPRTGQWCA